MISFPIFLFYNTEFISFSLIYPYSTILFNTYFCLFLARLGLTLGEYTDGAFGTPASIAASVKVKSLDGVFEVASLVTGKVTFITDKIVDFVSMIIEKIFSKGKDDKNE